ncbi:MAG: helix-turn-helix transcriptional regulator [Rubrivivax sp.]
MKAAGAAMQQSDELIDAIYEAAVISDQWPSVLEQLGGVARATNAALLAFDPQRQLRHTSTRGYVEHLKEFASKSANYENRRPIRALQRGETGFLHDLEIFTQAELDADPIYQDFMYPMGYGWSAGVVVPAPTSDLIVFDMVKARDRGPFERTDMDRLEYYRPHLARAGLLAHRLGLQAARSATDALGIVGLPAAALSSAGRVLSANLQLQALGPRVRIGAFDQLQFEAPRVTALFEAALAGAAQAPVVQSIPLPASGTANALVLHVVPVRRLANDIFHSTAAILVVTEVTQPSAPLTGVLTGLFDLTPAEARVAQGLASGLSVNELAQKFGTSRDTVRTQLSAIYNKTGTDAQTSLLLLLHGTRPLGD